MLLLSSSTEYSGAVLRSLIEIHLESQMVSKRMHHCDASAFCLLI